MPTLGQLRQLVINEQFSRIPGDERTSDHIRGFVHVRDMFEIEEEEREHRTVRELVRNLIFVPEPSPSATSCARCSRKTPTW